MTAYTSFYQMMWSIWGAPINPLGYVSLLGSTLLFGGAISCVFSERIAGYIALAGLFFCWAFYLPGALMTNWLLLPRAGKEGIAAVASLLLLIITTFYTVRVVIRTRKGKKSAATC